MRLLLAFFAIAALTLLPSLVGAQEPLLVTPDDAAPILDPTDLPALFPVWFERLSSYAFALGSLLITLANLGNAFLTRLRAAGRVPPLWIDLTVGLLLDAGTDLVALRERLAGKRG